MINPMPIQKRIERHIRVLASGCHEWTGDTFPDGYARIWMQDFPRPKGRRAHRIVWEMVNGPIPAGMMVCHKCDNKRCVNPDHLFLGTALDNARDREKKGRQLHPEGEENHQSKLSARDVRDIRWEVSQRGTSYAELAARYGVSTSAIGRCVRGKTWTCVKYYPNKEAKQ